jgi:hypothetical protein
MYDIMLLPISAVGRGYGFWPDDFRGGGLLQATPVIVCMEEEYLWLFSLLHHMFYAVTCSLC